MYKKLSSLIIFTLALCLVRSAIASTIWDDDATSDHYWTTYGNWSSGPPSGLFESASIMTLTVGERGPIITSSMSGLEVNNLHVEVPAGQTTVITMTGGDLTSQAEIWLIAGTGAGRAEFEMVDGLLTVGSELRLGGYGTDGGHLQLNGGRVETSTLYIRDNGSIDISGTGALVVDGDVTSQIQGFIGAGTVTAYDGAGEVLINYSGGKTTVTAAEQEAAHHPSPFDAGTEVAVDATLSWTAGDNTDSHDVYFGTDWKDRKSVV